MSTPRIVIYPGTFDPITNGHFDLIKRASELFDKVIVAVAQSSKSTFFTLPERLQFVNLCIADLDCVKALSFSNLLVDLVVQHQACAVIRGLRAVSDFEYEFQLASMNRRLNPQVETIFLTPAEENSFISSTLVREVAQLQGDISAFIPTEITHLLAHKFGNKPRS